MSNKNNTATHLSHGATTDTPSRTALDDTSKFMISPNAPNAPNAPRVAGLARDGIERLLRATAHLIENDDNDPMKVAVRVAVEQLHRKDSALRRECLTFAAEQLADARSRWRVHSAQDEILIELLRAACLARTGREQDARSLVTNARERASNVIERRGDELTRLEASTDPGAAARAATLRTEPTLGLDAIDAIAVDVQRTDG